VHSPYFFDPMIPSSSSSSSSNEQSKTRTWTRTGLILIGAALLFGGCSISKWTVKPHQRELLADRIMQLDADAQEREAEEHVLANREGAIGGTGTSGGGCGCN
jgi:hypothetical protein